MKRPWSKVPTGTITPRHYACGEPVIIDESHEPDIVEDFDAMDALDLVRSTVLVVDHSGTILQAYGGAGRPLGYRAEDLVGRNGIEVVAPEDHYVMATLAVETGDTPTVSSPEPFPLRLVGPDGTTKTWDCAATGFDKAGRKGWVVMMTSRKDQNAALEAMECFISGGSALEIAAVVAQRHQIASADGWRKQALVVYRVAPTSSSGLPKWHALSAPPSVEPALVEALQRSLNDPRAPWQNLPPGATITCSDLPEPLQRAVDEVGLVQCSALGVGIDGESHIVFLRFSNFEHVQQSNGKLADQAVESVLRRALEAERSRDLLHVAVRSDPITGIPNRLSFEEAIATTDPSVHPAVLFVDIDRFKAVNDTYGHAAGDATLREVANRVVRACRPQDLVARIGGDEFAVILHHVTPIEAQRVAERIQASMGEPLPPEIGPDLISVTVGIAAPDPDVSLVELVELADHEMLTKKGPSGRDVPPPEAPPLSLAPCPADIRGLDAAPTYAITREALATQAAT